MGDACGRDARAAKTARRAAGIQAHVSAEALRRAVRAHPPERHPQQRLRDHQTKVDVIAGHGRS